MIAPEEQAGSLKIFVVILENILESTLLQFEFVMAEKMIKTGKRLGMTVFTARLKPDKAPAFASVENRMRIITRKKLIKSVKKSFLFFIFITYISI